jgi:hypothetical protein
LGLFREIIIDGVQLNSKSNGGPYFPASAFEDDYIPLSIDLSIFPVVANGKVTE